VARHDVVGEYRDPDAVRHEVLVQHTSSGGWQVLDRSTAATRVIDTLDGDEDGRPQADAIARDYLATVAQSTPTRELESTEATPEEGGADVDSDHSRRSRAPRRRARRASVPDPAR
jgi:hypothetical protein